MFSRRLARPARLPSFLLRLSSDEFPPPALTGRDHRARHQTFERGLAHASRTDTPLAAYWSGRRGTAAGLRALNAASGREWYDVPAEAELEEDAAAACFDRGEIVVDVQTHFVADRAGCGRWVRQLQPMYSAVAPEWWRGLDDLTAYDVGTWLRCVFGESETALAVLTSAPGLGDDRMLHDREMAATKALFERLGGGRHLLHHCVVQPEARGGLDAMEAAAERYRPAAWKAYTLERVEDDGTPAPGWWLDDEATGAAFLERARASGVRRVCVHKGISFGASHGSPRDVGPAAAAFPDLDFLIYHSGYEIASGAAPEEGPFEPEGPLHGTDRLVASLREAGVGPCANVHAELGSTWFCLIRRPEEAAHVLGKLLLAVGEDNVVWGTDSIWYGSPQPAIDAFRSFQIPAELRDRHGYPELTPERKAKILGRNAARIYGLDLDALARAQDDLAWLRAVSEEATLRGVLDRG